MLSTRELRKAINNVADNLTDKEVMLSQAFKKYAENIVKGVGKIYEIPTFKLTVFWGDKSQEYNAAATNSRCEFLLNVNNILTKDLNRQKRFRVSIGLLCHEIGHRLWTNLAYQDKLEQKIRNGSVGYADTIDLDEYLRNFPDQKKAVAMLSHSVMNVIEDGYIENRFLHTYPGYRKYLEETRIVQKKTVQTIQQQKDNGYSKIAIIINQMLWYAKYGILPDEECDESEIIDYLLPYIEDAMKENDSKVRLRKYLTITSLLLRYLEKQEKEKQNDEDNSSTDSGDDSEEDSNSATSDDDSDSESDGTGSDSTESESDTEDDSEGEEGTEDDLSSPAESQDLGLSENDFSGISGMVSNNSDSYAPLDNDTNADNDSELTSNNDSIINHADGKTEDEKDDDLNNIEEEIAEEKVSEQEERNLQKEINTLKSHMDFTNYHKNISSTIKRISDTSKSADFDQLNAWSEVLLRRLVKEWEKKIHDLQTGEKLTGLYCGRTIKQPYRTDLKRWASKKAPCNIPDMSIMIYVDLSGSMYGEKAEAARKTAFIIYKFCLKMGIRCAVYGHNSLYGEEMVHLYSFAEFDSIDGKDIFRISNLNNYVDDCNRDGYGLRFCSELLARETSRDKLLIVISDGAPNDTDYGYCYVENKPNNWSMECAGNAKCDIYDILREYAKKNISYITAGLGTCKEEIEDLYTYGISPKIAPKFLDISDLDAMPKKFIEILKAKILAN